MKGTLGIFVFFLAFTLCQAQEGRELSLAFRDDFNTNDYTWSASKIKSHALTRGIGNGTMYIAQMAPRYMITERGFPFNPRRDFRIEVECMQESATSVSGIGLHISASPSKWFFTLASLSQRYNLVHYRENTFMTLDEERDPFEDSQTGFAKQWIQGLGKNNTLALVRQGDSLHFYINDKALLSLPIASYFNDFKGFDGVGIVSFGEQTSYINYFECRQEVLPVALADDASAFPAPEDCGASVNLPSTSELAPVVTHDGQYLYFSRRTFYTDSPPVRALDRVVYAQKDSVGKWVNGQYVLFSSAESLPSNVMSITPDNNTMLVYYATRHSPTESGFAIATRTEQGWSKPIPLHIRQYWSSSTTTSACLAPNAKVLFLALEREDSRGGQDLYICFRENDSVFSEPINIGDAVNTFGTEITPFMAGDGRTLFFSSNGHPGYGDNDIFVCKRLDESWLRWSAPRNCGNMINSCAWDAYFSLPASGEYAYISTTNGSSRSYTSDIYRIRLRQPSPSSTRNLADTSVINLCPDPVIILSGRVLNFADKKGIGARITYRNLANNSELGIASSDSAGGYYKLILSAGAQYSFYAEREGFYPTSEHLDVRALGSYTELHKDLFLSPIEVGQTIVINNIFFEYNQATLSIESNAELDRLSVLMTSYPNMTISISGHTDSVGGHEFNIRLSQERAKAVKQYLITKGISPERMATVGRGLLQPVAPNSNDEGRQKNRRVEFTITRK